MPRTPVFGPQHHALLLIGARLTFVAASLVVAYGVFAPPGHGVALMPWDKAEHFTAFFGLMGIGLAAFPRASLWVLGLSLSAAGAAVEVIQGTPWVGRDADVMDWVADTIGILAIVGVIVAAHLRRALSPKRPGA